MIVLMHAEATAAQTAGVIEAIEARGLRALPMPGGEHTAIGIPSAIPPEMRDGLAGLISTMPGVDHVVHVSRPYKLASREFHPASTVVQVGGAEIGGAACVVMAGPCAVESREQIIYC